MQKARKISAVTDNLNKHLQKAMTNFSNNAAWTDINNWLQNIEVIIRQNPSPYIVDKITLSKRLSQCLNPALPAKVHELVLKIHEQMLANMRNAVDGNINEYIKMFAQDIGLYSVGLIPFFSQTGSTDLRVMLLDIFNNYYMDLGRELIPLLPGLLISILPVYQETLDEVFKKLISETLLNLQKAAGRRYYIGSLWTCILRFERCRTPGIKLLQKIIPFMRFLAEEEELDESHGFSDEEQQLKRLQDQVAGKMVRKSTANRRKSERFRIKTEQNSLAGKIQELGPPPEPIKQISFMPALNVPDQQSKIVVEKPSEPTKPDNSPVKMITLDVEQDKIFNEESAKKYNPITLVTHVEQDKNPIKQEQDDSEDDPQLSSLFPQDKTQPKDITTIEEKQPQVSQTPHKAEESVQLTEPVKQQSPQRFRAGPSFHTSPSANIENPSYKKSESKDKEETKSMSQVKASSEIKADSLTPPIHANSLGSPTIPISRLGTNFPPPPPGFKFPPGTLPPNFNFQGMPPPPPGFNPQNAMKTTQGMTLPPPNMNMAPTGTNLPPPPPGMTFPPNFKIPPDGFPPMTGPMPPGFKMPPPDWKPPADFKMPPNFKPPTNIPMPPPPTSNPTSDQKNLISIPPPPPQTKNIVPPTVAPPGVKITPPQTTPTNPPPPNKGPNVPPPPPGINSKPSVPLPSSSKITPSTQQAPTFSLPAPPTQPKIPLQPIQPKPIDPKVSIPIQPNQNKSVELTKISTSAPAKQQMKALETVQRTRKKVAPLDRVPYVMTPELQQIKEKIDEDNQQNNFPNENTLVLNSLISCLEDPEPLVKRTVLDFLYSHLRLKNKVLSEEDKKVLVEVVLRLFVRKQLTITKRVNGWLFGKPDDQNKYLITDKNEFVIDYIINGLSKILSRQPKNQIDCVVPLKILQNFYMEHDHLVKLTLSPLVLPIVRYVFNFSLGYEFSGQVMKSGQRFFQNLPSYYGLIYESLGAQLIDGLEHDDDLKCFQVVKYIDYCYIRLMHHEFGYQQLDYLTTLMTKLGQALYTLSDSSRDLSKYSFVKGIVLLIVNLIDRKQRIMSHLHEERKKQHQHYEEQKTKASTILLEDSSVQLPQEMVDFQNEMDQKELRRERQFTAIASNIERFFIKLGKVIRVVTSLHPYEQTYKLTSLAITKIQKHLPRQPVKVLPAWFDTIESGIKIMNPVIELSAIEAMIYCLTAQNVHPAYSSYRSLIVAERNKKNDYQKQALEKLWSLLDYPHMHRKIIDLIVNFSKYFPYQFTVVVSKSFQTHNVPQKEASIQRFSNFWRLTGFKYKDLLIQNQQLSQLNKVGLFVMLDFLEDDNPLVRHAAKNWLLQSMALFYRVLDPLFLELMEGGNNIYETPKGQQIINKKFDTKKIFSIFRRIRSILTNGGLSFLRYIFQTAISDVVQDAKTQFTPVTYPVITKPMVKKVESAEPVMIKEPVLPKAVLEAQQQNKSQQLSIQKLTYMDLLIIISLKYIKGQAIESMGIEFHVGNSAVNASSIQFLESFLGYIDTPDLCQRFINFILDDLFKVLEQGIANREYIIQIQLLNLFKTIFFNSSFRLKGQVPNIRQLFSRVFSSHSFMASLLRGLSTPFSYVRSQFISFISISVPLIADFLQVEQCTHCIKNILFSYYEIIKSVNMRSMRQKKEEMEHNDEDIPANLKRIVQFKEKTIRQDRVIKFTDNLTEVAKTNEILAILHGVSAVLNYFFQLDRIDYKKIEFTFSNPYTMFDKLKYVMTLTLANSVKQEKLITKTVFLHNLETSQSILRDIQPVFETILRAWPLSEEYVRIATYQFSQIGVKSFDFDRFNKYNRVLTSLINYVNNEKDSIWGKIISIMRPMFYKFPKEIVSIYMQLWIRECPNMDNNGSFESMEASRTEFLMKIVETLIVNDFPLNILVAAFVEAPIVENLKEHYLSRKKDQKKGNVLEYQKAVIQSKLIYFVHVYFHYVHHSPQTMEKEKLRELWGLIIKVIKPFYPSKNPNTNLWILQFFNLCAKKYSPKEILSDESFKSQLHLMINQKLKFVAGIASKQFNFFYEQPKLEMRALDSPIDSQSYRIILPYTPSIYQLYLMRKTKEFKHNHINHELFSSVKPGSNQDIERRNRFYSFKTLKRLGLELIQNTYLPQKNQWIIRRTKQWIDIIMPVIGDKNTENMVFAECASEVIHDLLQKARSFFMKSMRLDLLALFNKDDFFICNVQTLKYWMKIIYWVVTAEKTYDTFRDYLDKVALSTSYFSNQDAENKKRVKSFERICFLLYSGTKDLYAKELKTLLPKISQILKNSETAHPSLLVLILFSLRILILRLSSKNLSELFTDIWPMIMTLLIQLFSRKAVKVTISSEVSKNPNLLLAALKLVEMMSITKLIQFSNNQWIFIYDYFGLKMTISDANMQLVEFINQRPQLKGIITTEKAPSGVSPFIYKPYLTNYFPQYSINYTPKKSEMEPRSTPLKRKLIIKQHKVTDQNELRVKAIVLCQYLININELLIEVDEEEVDMLIVNDFISLDQFIHKLT